MAAAVPVWKLSAVTVPDTGISIWVWASMKPGKTRQPEASTTRSPGSSGAMRLIFSPSMSMSAICSPPEETRVPPFITVLISAQEGVYDLAQLLRKLGGVGEHLAVETEFAAAQKAVIA